MICIGATRALISAPFPLEYQTQRSVSSRPSASVSLAMGHVAHWYQLWRDGRTGWFFACVHVFDRPLPPPCCSPGPIGGPLPGGSSPSRPRAECLEFPPPPPRASRGSWPGGVMSRSGIPGGRYIECAPGGSKAVGFGTLSGFDRGPLPRGTSKPSWLSYSSSSSNNPATSRP